MQRVISVDDCRVTKYAIKWNEMEEQGDEYENNVEMSEENIELDTSQNELNVLQDRQQNRSDELEILQENIEFPVKEFQNISVNKGEIDGRLSQEIATKSF